MTECQAALDTLRELQANAPALMVLLAIAVAALLWQFYDDYRRDQACKGCAPCLQRLHGTPDPTNLPPPSSGVLG